MANGWLPGPGPGRAAPFLSAPREQFKTLRARSIPEEPLFVSLVRTEQAQVFRACLGPLLSAATHTGALRFGQGQEDGTGQPAG